jgi:hypothetical protein
LAIFYDTQMNLFWGKNFDIRRNFCNFLQKMDDSLIFPGHFGLCDIHVWDELLCDLRKYFCKAQKWKLLTGLTSAWKENYKFAQKED